MLCLRGLFEDSSTVRQEPAIATNWTDVQHPIPKLNKRPTFDWYINACLLYGQKAFMVECSGCVQLLVPAKYANVKLINCFN